MAREKADSSIPGVSLCETGLTGSRIMTKYLLSFRQVEFDGPKGAAKLIYLAASWTEVTQPISKKNLHRNSSSLTPNN